MSATPALELHVSLRCYAVKVRGRGEEAVANALREKGYQVLSPGYTELRRYSDRTRKVRCALFPGYVFVRMDPKNLLRLLSTDGVNYVVRSGSTMQPLTPEETLAIEALCRMEGESEASCEPCSYLSVGQRVVIESGPMAGLEGVLLRVRGVDRVVIAVESLHQSVAVEIRNTRVRAIDSPSEALTG